jgi:hypothetical protein
MSVTSGPRPALAPVRPVESTSLFGGVRRTAASTPGRLGLAMLGLVVLSLVTGVVGLLSIQGRASTLTDLTTHREPFSAAAQQMYRSLSPAAATAASAFLTSAVAPPDLRQRYETDIERAGAALSVAATDVEGVPEAARPLSQLATGIPVYTGLVERASANNAQGFPIGSAYLREADHLMQATLLPAAQALYAVDTQRVIEAQDSATSFPWAAVVLVVVLLAALVVTQRYLRRRTNRLLNVGLVIATGAVVVALLWSATGLILETVHVAHARSTGSAPADTLAQARTKALQARTDEMLTLVARGGQNYEQPFRTLTNAIGGKDGSGGLLGQVRGTAPGLAGQVDRASAAAKSWFGLHAQAAKANQNGDYATAVGITRGASGKPNEAAAFDRVDTALDRATTQARAAFTDQTSAAGGWLTALPVGVLVLLVLAAAGAAIGLWQRLREYR